MNWKDTQLIYHALARMNMESLVLTTTKASYTCIGFAQDLRKEIDIDYCREHGIPYFRRETGGGTVYLDKNQLFYQLIIHRDNPLTPKNTETFFRRFLSPVISTLEKLGISAKFVPLNDLIVEDKKISGNGGGEIGDCKVLVGNLLLDFDFKRMASILNVPNEEFREKVYHNMLKNLTTIKSELGYIPPSEEIRKYLAREYEKLLGPLTSSGLGEDMINLMKNLDEKFSTEEWLFQKVPKREGREVKIREGVLIIYRKFLTKKWEAEMIFQLKEGRIEDLMVVKSSDPKIQIEILKEGLSGIVFEEKQVLNNINELYER